MDRRGRTAWSVFDARTLWTALVVGGYITLLSVVAFLIAVAAAALAAPAFEMQAWVWGTIFLAQRTTPAGTTFFSGRMTPTTWAIAAVAGGVVLLAVLVQVAFALRAGNQRRLLHRLYGTVPRKGELAVTKHELYAMSLAAGCEVSPPLYLIAGPGTNAAVFGTSLRSCTVAVTPAFTKLEPEWQRAALASLLARLRYERMPALVVLSALLAPVVRLNVLDRIHRVLPNPEEESVRFKIAFVVVVAFLALTGSGAIVLLFVFPMVCVLLFAALVAWASERKSYADHIRLARFGDVEGMMLLKDPAVMLDALHEIVVTDNEVAGAGTYGLFFYCWPKTPPPSARDPELGRVDDLRELLGADGIAV